MDSFLHIAGPIIAWIAAGTVSIILIIFWANMLLSAVKNPRVTKFHKIIWIIVIVGLDLVGAVLYYFMAYKDPGPKDISSAAS